MRTPSRYVLGLPGAGPNHPSNVKGVVALFRAYFDDSGTHAGSAVIVLGGLIGTDGQWGEIDNPGDLAIYERMVKDGELTLEG